MAVDEINAKGGVLGGKKLKLFVEDDEATPEKTVNSFNKLVTQNKVVGIVGALTSSCSLSITPEAQKRKIIMITPSSTNDTVTDAGDYIFRACFTDKFQGTSIAKYAVETLKAKKAAVLFDVTSDYSKGLKDNFKAKFEELGGTVEVVESYQTGDQDFNAQVTKIKASNPDVLLLPEYYNDVSLIAKQVKNQGMNIPMLGGDGWDEIANNAGQEVVGGVYSNHYSPDAKESLVQDFVKNYEAKFKVTPNALAALAYDATYILAEAINKAGSLDAEKIKAAMKETNRDSVTGHISFNEKRDSVKPITMVKLEKDGDTKVKAVFDSLVNP
jgi:branched-chain amino acid transport system substrate-binding protein